MSKILLIILFLFGYYNIYSNSELDSLMNIAKNGNQDTTTVNAYEQIGEIKKKDNVDEAIIYFEKAIELAKKIGWDKKFISINNAIGVIFANQGNFDKAIEYTTISYNKAIQIGDVKSTVTCLLHLGIHYQRMGLLEKSIGKIIEASKLALDNNFKEELARCYISLGNIYNILKKSSESIDYNNRAIKILKEIDNKKLLTNAYSNIANVYIDLDSNKKALEYLELGLEIERSTKDSIGIAIKYHSLAAVYSNLKKFNLSIEYLLKSIEMKKRLNYKTGIAVSYFGLAEVYFDLQQYDNSLKYLDLAKEFFLKSKSYNMIMNSYLLYDKIYLIKKDYEKAYNYKNLYYQIKDSLFNEKTNKAINELNTKFNVSVQEKENELLRSKSDKQILIIFVFILVTAIIVIIVIALYIKNKSIKKTNQILNENKIRIENQNYELEILNKELNQTNLELQELNSTKDKFFSIIAHDLINPLSGQHRLIELLSNNYNEFSKEEIQSLIYELSKSSSNTVSLLENLLTWSRSQRNLIQFNPETFTLADLAKLTLSHLETIAKDKNISLINNIDKSFDVHGDRNMIMAIIRNITSNAIKFTSEGGIVKIDASDNDDNYYTVSISDNGVGMDEIIRNSLFNLERTRSTPGTNEEKGTGLGLVLCKEFIDKHKCKIWVESESGKGTTFYFTLPKAK